MRKVTHPSSILTLVISLVYTASASTISLDKPFQNDLKNLPQSPCVSLFHRNGRIGCGTYSRDTMTGRLLHWSTLLSSAQYYNDLELPSFVAVLNEIEFTADTIGQLLSMNANNNLLQGILVLNSTDASLASGNSPAPMSPRGENTPSYQLNPDSNYEWNVNGDGLLNEDLYGVPSGFVNDVDVADYLFQTSKDQSELILTSSNENGESASNTSSDGFFSATNVNVPPVLAEFNSYMGPGDTNTTNCLGWIDNDDVWRPKCLPLGGNSVWAKAGSQNSAEESIVLVATGIDSTSMFHDIAPGASTTASNILTLLMAAKLLGESVDDNILNGLDKKIVFAFFQGEQYGFIGSRSFLRDTVYPGFECDDGKTVSTVSSKKDDDSYLKKSCLSPLRQDLAFTNLTNIDSMIAIDQVGLLASDNTFYVHDSGNSNGLSNIMLSTSSDNWTVSEGSAGSIPPTPLSSLVQLSGGDIGGIVLSGYDDSFVNDAFYLSHADSNTNVGINIDAIAKAATFVARAALASAYGGDNSYYDSAVEYAEKLIPELDSTDSTLSILSDCLLTNGRCDTFKKYSTMERSNNREETGFDIGIGQELGKVPNYYVSIFDGRNGQPYASINGEVYGTYTGDKEFGSDGKDAVLVRPNMLESGIYGLLNYFLGRNATADDDLKSCQSLSDCTNVLCSNDSSAAVCTGSQVCVCPRSHYHTALDEAIIAAPNNSTGRFIPASDDEGVSPAYSEPYWDSDIGVQVYREGQQKEGWALSAGLVLTGILIASTVSMKKSLRKEKLY